MKKLLENIKKESEWIVKTLHTDGFYLDHSISSFLELDQFIKENTLNGEPIFNGALASDMQKYIFSISCYIGECLILKRPNARWMVNRQENGEHEYALVFEEGSIFWPIQHVRRRIVHGNKESIFSVGFYFSNVKKVS